MTDTTPADAARADDQSTLEALANLPSFYHPSTAPDGDAVAFYYDGGDRNELCLQDVATGERTQVSAGNVPEDASYPPVWDASGDRLFFHQDADGNEQNDIVAITLDGDVTTVVENDAQLLLWDVSPDGDWLLYSSTHTGQMNFHRYDVDAGESTQLTDHGDPVFLGCISPDGERVAYRVNERDHPENEDVYVMNADGGDARRLDVGELGSESAPVDWHPDGDRLLVGDDAADVGRVGLYDLDADEVTWYGPGEYEEKGSYVLPDGDRFLAVRTHDCEETPVLYDVDDPEFERELAFPDGTAGLPDGPQRNGVLADGRVLVTHESPTSRESLHAYDLGTDAVETLVDADHGPFDPETDFVDADVVTYESTDGLEIEALCYDSGERPSPAVVLVHGGPAYHYSKSFNVLAQFLADRGYSVLAPNYRGSTGRGREFRNRIREDWGGMEQEDVAEAGRWLKRQDWVDGDRVAVYGGSYGGYSTYMQLVQRPGFWTAGVASVGMTDLQRLHEESMPHFATYLERQLGDPEENADFYRERSAIAHVDEMTDPILMIHGVNDPRCPVSQARGFRDALEARGWTVGDEFEYEELGEEGHNSTTSDHKLTVFRLLADFLDRRV